MSLFGLELFLVLQFRQVDEEVLGLDVNFLVDDLVLGQDVYRVFLAHEPNIETEEGLLHCSH